MHKFKKKTSPQFDIKYYLKPARRMRRVMTTIFFVQKNISLQLKLRLSWDL